MCGVTREKFYARYHETESGRTGHLKEIGEEVEVQKWKKKCQCHGGTREKIFL